MLAAMTSNLGFVSGWRLPSLRAGNLRASTNVQAELPKLVDMSSSMAPLSVVGAACMMLVGASARKTRQNKLRTGRAAMSSASSIATVPGTETTTATTSFKEADYGASPGGYWDPLGLSVVDGKKDPINLSISDEQARWRDYRAKELKHGRLAMISLAGMWGQCLVKLPSMEAMPSSVDAAFVGNGPAGVAFAFAVIGWHENQYVQDPNKEPGEFDDPLGAVNASFLGFEGSFSDEMRARELNNGRLAMFGSIGMIAASLYTGKSPLELITFVAK